jgi:hypothetical protein
MSKAELPKLPHVARRMDAARREDRGIQARLLSFPVQRIKPGATLHFQTTAHSFFDPARLIVAVDGNPTEVVLTRATVGSEMVFDREIATAHFIDKIPTKADVATSDEWDDGGRVEYPRIAPGIQAELVIENRGDSPVTVSAAYLGLRSHSPFPWDEFDAPPWDHVRR